MAGRRFSIGGRDLGDGGQRQPAGEQPLIAALFGFTGISAATAGIARILFFIAIVVFVVFLVLALMAGNAIL